MNISIFNMSHPSNLLLSITCGTIGSIGMPANFFLLILIASEYKKRKPHEWLLFMLSFGDFLLCLNNACMEAPFVIDHDRIECKVAGAIDYLLGTLSFFTPPLVAYNRYVSLYDHQRYVKIFTTRSVIASWFSILVFGLCWLSPYVVTGSLGQDDLGLCGTQMRYPYLQAIMVGVISAIFLSYILLLYYSYKVIIKIRNHKKDATAQSQMQSRLISESREIITVMLIISAVPLFAQMPGATMKLLNIFLPPMNPWIARMAIAPFPLTSAVNAYVTIYVVKDYRKKTLRLFGKSPAQVHALDSVTMLVSQGVGQWMQQTTQQNDKKADEAV